MKKKLKAKCTQACKNYLSKAHLDILDSEDNTFLCYDNEEEELAIAFTFFRDMKKRPADPVNDPTFKETVARETFEEMLIKYIEKHSILLDNRVRGDILHVLAFGDDTALVRAHINALCIGD